MRIKHQLPDPSPEKPFEHDKLKRESQAKALTKICDLYDDGFVLALNGEWGTGKSTFIKMWLASLQNSRPTAYFNAWSDDYSNDPLPALLATFKSLKGEDKLTDSKRKIWEEIVGFSGKLVKNALPALAGLLAKRYIGVDNIDKLGEALTKGGIEYINDEVKDFSERQEDLKKLQQLLTEFVSEKDQKKKAVVVIDELDRCRPHYAVAVLELIKHLFSVNGVVFVLAIDKEQLKHAICGVYGSEQLNATSYLLRFIDVEFALSSPNEDVLVRYFIDYYQLGPGYVNLHNVELGAFESDFFESLLVALVKHQKLPIRNLEKLLVKVKLGLETIRPNEYKLPELLLFLAYLTQCYPTAIEMLSGTKIPPSNLLLELRKYLPQKEVLTNEVAFYLAYIEAGILIFYNNHFQGRSKLDIRGYLNVDNRTAIPKGFESYYEDKADSFAEKLQFYFNQRSHRLNMVELRYFIKKITQFSGLD